MNVGVTINLRKGMNIFMNGIGQNALMVYDLLKKISFIDNVYLVHMNKELQLEDLQDLTYLHGYDVIHWDEKETDTIDLMIILGVAPHDTVLSHWKSKDQNRRAITYKGGNSMVLMTEDLLFHRKWGQRDNKDLQKNVSITAKGIDEIWMVPQQEYHNKDFFEITYGVEAKSVPFVWSPKFIEQEYLLKKQVKSDLELEFDRRNVNDWYVISMEPNTSVLKNMVPILFILEQAYKENPEKFKQFNISNASEFKDNPLLIDIVSELQIQKDGKLGFDPRWTTATVLTQIANMIISHQWGNPLNYAYLDVVYYGYPLVHNAHLCKDIGYYYEDFKLKDAAKLLLKAAEERKQDVTYMQRHREILKRYQADTNQAMVDQYANLIKSLWGNATVSGEYNWKSNLIEG